jgi:hypothetical protein
MYNVIHDKPKLNSSMSLIEEACALSILYTLMRMLVSHGSERSGVCHKRTHLPRKKREWFGAVGLLACCVGMVGIAFAPLPRHLLLTV